MGSYISVRREKLLRTHVVWAPVDHICVNALVRKLTKYPPDE
jgi:hypothetical protein